MAVIMISLSLLITILFIIFDLLPIYEQKQQKAFWVYVILNAFAFIIFIFIALDIKLPSPAMPIKKVVSSIFGLQN